MIGDSVLVVIICVVVEVDVVGGAVVVNAGKKEYAVRAGEYVYWMSNSNSLGS